MQRLHMNDKRMDYLDILCDCPERKGSVSFFGRDEENNITETKLLTYDGDAVELFLHLNIPYKTIPLGRDRYYYHSEDKTIYWARHDLRKPSIQLKGKFFLQPDYKIKLQMIMDFLLKREIFSHVSRCDLGILFECDEARLYRHLLKMNWGDMTSFYRIKNKKGIGFNSENSRRQVDFYNKHRQLEQSKKHDPEYKTLLLEVIGLSETNENLLKVDLRLIQKDQNRGITEALMSNNIDFDKIEKIVINRFKEKIKFSRPVNKLLFK